MEASTLATEPVYYSLSEAARLLGIHYETAARWMRTGKLAGVKLSRRKVVVPKEKLDAFLAGIAPQPEPRSEVGSPQRWLALVGTLTPEEAALLRRSTEDFEKIE